MKKIIIILLCVFSLHLTANAGTDQPIAIENLPNTAKQFINNHFKNSKLSYAKVDSEWFDKEYKVYFTNGNKIEFNKKGDWVEIDCKYSQVPAGVAPKIEKYVSENFKGVNILEIEKDDNHIDVKLSNRLKLKFDFNHNFLKFD